MRSVVIKIGFALIVGTIGATSASAQTKSICGESGSRECGQMDDQRKDDKTQMIIDGQVQQQVVKSSRRIWVECFWEAQSAEMRRQIKWNPNPQSLTEGLNEAREFAEDQCGEMP